jgi:molecular chaperone HtpG
MAGGMLLSRPTSVALNRRSSRIIAMTGGTARIVSRRPFPASQSRMGAAGVRGSGSIICNLFNAGVARADRRPCPWKLQAGGCYITRACLRIAGPIQSTSRDATNCHDRHRNDIRQPRDARLPGRGERAPQPDDSLALFEPEIFLRELISNASDACDKLRFEALDNPALFEGDAELAIHVDYDADARTLTVSDNGIGMNRDEVIANLGTIAKSGTREFFSQLTGDQQKDAHLIGQFGVGFYSSFIVADKVTVETRRAGDPPAQGVRWTSDGGGEFDIEPIDRPRRGTAITLHLREGQNDLLSGSRLRSIIRKYSDHIVQPILMKKETWQDDKQMKSDEDETVNQASALWARPKSEITDEQYKEFYKHVGHDFDDPLAWSHARVEGRQEYTELLYIPAHPSFDLWDRTARHGIRLYVRRVFIMDDAEQLLPAYLRFVRGIVDSNDLPLNISREILQESRDIEAIRAGCTKKVLDLLANLAANDKEKYTTFWKAFGSVVKEGVGEDFANKEKIAGLLRFATTHADGPTNRCRSPTTSRG